MALSPQTPRPTRLPLAPAPSGGASAAAIGLPKFLAMPSETETLALHLVRALYDATGGQPFYWRMSAEIDRETADAIEVAVARGG
jgi:hypothetical protein